MEKTKHNGGFKMNEIRKRKLLMEYKHRKTEMGVFVFECIATGKSYIGFTHDTRAALNSDRFKLNAGMHPNIKLQNEWKSYGESSFAMRVLEVLNYDEKDEAKIDYTEELSALRDKWNVKLKGSEFI